MRYIKVLLLVILFFLVMMFFVQNQAAFSQAVPLKLDLLFMPALESAPLQKKLEASETKAAQLAEDVENAKKAVSDAANA